MVRSIFNNPEGNSKVSAKNLRCYKYGLAPPKQSRAFNANLLSKPTPAPTDCFDATHLCSLTLPGHVSQ
jgi:hypothetical protein